MSRLPLILALLGLATILLLLTWFDVGAVWTATRAIGWPGFALLIAWQGVLSLILGTAWRAVLPTVSWPLLIWGRMVRDAATTCLPFSPVGGYVIGARALTLHAVPWTLAAAGTVIDVTAELSAQLLFALFGLAILLLLRPGSGPTLDLALPLALGLAAATALLLTALWQRRRLGTALRALGRRLLGDWFSKQGGLDRLEATLAALYAPSRLLRGTALHLVGWCGTGVGTWLTLHLLGVPVDLLHVLALEALLDALVAAAFLVPGAAGVQEGGYILLGALFGVPAELALGVSLLRRAKDLAWGVPILLLWQARELRRLAR